MDCSRMSALLMRECVRCARYSKKRRTSKHVSVPIIVDYHIISQIDVQSIRYEESASRDILKVPFGFSIRAKVENANSRNSTLVISAYELKHTTCVTR